MIYRKTWFSYVLWAVYAMLCVIFLIFVGNDIFVNFFLEGSGRDGLSLSLPKWSVLLISMWMIPVAAASYLALRGISGKVRRKFAWRKKNCRAIEWIVVVLFLALGIFLRVMRASEYISFQNTAEDHMQAYVNGMDYYQMAVVTKEGTTDQLAYGGAYLYVLCLSFVLSFLGNKAASAIVFQTILQIMGLGLSYLVTRKIAGRLPACIVLLYLACSAGSLEMLKNFGPECLFFVLYLLGMLAAVSFVKGYCENRFRIGQTVAGALAVGALIGSLCYLDLAAVVILPVLAALFTGKKRHTKHKNGSSSPVVSSVAAVMTVLSGILFFMGVVGVASYYKGSSFWMELRNWTSLHIQSNGTFGYKPLYPYSLDMILLGGLTLFAAFLVFEFFRSGKEQNYMLWILLCILAAPTPMAVIGVQPFGIISMYLWGVLAGLGLQNCIFGDSARLMQAVIEEINQAAEEAQQQENLSAAAEIENPEKERVEEKERAKTTEDTEARTAEGTETGKAEDTEAGKAEGTEKEQETAPSRPRFLENPLPLPKKHVHKQMEYQYTVEDAQMKFDIEISENDEFDV